MSGGRTHVGVELWVEPMPAGEYALVVERLRELVDAGLVDRFAVRTWDRYVDAAFDPRDPRKRRLATFDRLCDRDASDAVDAAPTTVGVGRMGPERLVRRVPRAVLVELRDGDPVAVTPSGRGPRCLLEHLAAVARTDPTGSTGTAPPTAAP